MRYLITGHTGFKGAWLILLLKHLGHEVSGVALDPESESLFVQARLHEFLVNDLRGDIRDPATMTNALASCEPDVVVHMAAQPLVRASYAQPRLTVETNVIGTMNVLEATYGNETVKALLVVTTDKVYRNLGSPHGYSEGEALGGDDPYSASKAMADILTYAWGSSFCGPPTAILRAGNVIGGGDTGTDRLIPDLVRAARNSCQAQLRYPEAVRPWQHVLDCLSGYLSVADHLIQASPVDVDAWNVGPDEGHLVSVRQVASLFDEMWGTKNSNFSTTSAHPPEAPMLALDSRKLRRELRWHNVLGVEESVHLTVDWWKRVFQGENPRDVSVTQILELAPRLPSFQASQEGLAESEA